VRYYVNYSYHELIKRRKKIRKSSSKAQIWKDIHIQVSVLSNYK